MNIEPKLDLTLVPVSLHAAAHGAYCRGDVGLMMSTMDNLGLLRFVFDNIMVLKQKGLYEEALLDALVSSRTNNLHVPLDIIRLHIRSADRKTMMALGDPLPGDGAATIYRGVAGKTSARRVRGVSWTLAFETARWFATRYELPKPTVFKAAVEREHVYCYTNHREEQEIIVLLPPDARVVRVWGK